jgi:hypothetical protein
MSRPKTSTREQWLQQAILALTPLFKEQGYAVPKCHVSCGFASTDIKRGHIGQCWSSKASADRVNQIFISPALSDSVQVLDTLMHELVHAIDDCENKHGPVFKKMALKLGMKGPMRSACAGPELKGRLKQLVDGLGAYPHAKLNVPRKVIDRRPRPRAKCSECGFTVPMLKAFIHYGPPICPKDKIEMTAVGNWEESY